MSAAYGYRAIYERRKPRGGGIERVVIGRKGAQSLARSGAIAKSDFVRLVAVVPLSAAQYNTEFPPGAHLNRPRYCLITRA